MGGAVSNVDEALETLASLDEAKLDELVKEFAGDDNDDEGAGDAAATVVAGQETPRLDGGTAEPKPEAQSQESKPEVPKGAAVLDLFKDDTEAQALVKQQLDSWLRDASAKADAENAQKEFQKLVADGDFEAIGRRFVEDAETKKISSAAEEAALQKAYTDIYGGLFKELNQFTLTDDEKVRVDPDKYPTDAEYVLALTSFINEKKSGTQFEERVNKTATDRLEALKNSNAAKVAAGSSASTLVPAGSSTPTGSQTLSSRQLLQEGFRETLEQAADARVGLNQE